MSKGLLPNGLLAIAAVLSALVLPACSSRHPGQSWGADATFVPAWNQLGSAALRAATDPFTWAPAGAAAIIQIGDLDGEIAEWANSETPLFGSRETARDASDWLRNGSLAVYVATGLAAPVASGDNWLGSKAKGFAVGSAAIAATAASSGLLKTATGRERPLGQDDASFPSRHAALAGVGARLSSETLRYHDMPPGVRLASDTGLAGLVLMAGWARVEGGEHHPADVLVGAAIGNFLAVFASEAFLGVPRRQALALNVHPVSDGWMLNASLSF